MVSTTFLLGLVLLFLPKISQDTSYHYFADIYTFWGIPNYWNVLSNLPFIIIGIGGLCQLRNNTFEKQKAIIVISLFVGIVLTGLGSAYYHYAPENSTLVWDRIPMTIVFMSFLSLTIYDRVHKSTGYKLLFPLLFSGIGSVFYWILTENNGEGDLRFYAFVQFYPMIAIPLIMALFPSAGKKIKWLVWVIAFYVIAKLFEEFDQKIYEIIPLSGHSIKHLFAAGSTYFIVKYVFSAITLQTTGVNDQD